MVKGFIHSIRTRGAFGAARQMLARLSTWLSERRLGIRTSESFERDQLGYDTMECHRYSPTDYRGFRKIMRHVPIRANQDVFLDYGSGLGRALIMAGAYPFRRILGVELSHELNLRAAENVRRALRKLKCKEVEVIEADAAAYEVPPDVTVMYFYSPFSGAVLRRVLENVRRSLAAAPRKVTIIYKNPHHFEEEARRCPWLLKRAEYAGMSKHVFAIYESNLEAGSSEAAAAGG